MGLGRVFRQTIAQPDIFVDFSPFVTVLLSFFGAMFYFAEGMLGVQYGLRDYFQRFRHSSLSFLSLPEWLKPTFVATNRSATSIA